MTEKNLFVLVLRLSGMWTLLLGVMAIPWAISSLMKVSGWIPSDPGSFELPADYIWAELLRVPTYFLIGFVLLTKAPLIASFILWFSNAEDRLLSQSVDAVSLERIALQVLGFYALLHTIPFLSSGIAAGIQGTEGDVQQKTATVCYAAAAFALIFGARRITEWLTPAEEQRSPDTEHESP